MFFFKRRDDYIAGLVSIQSTVLDCFMGKLKPKNGLLLK